MWLKLVPFFRKVVFLFAGNFAKYCFIESSKNPPHASKKKRFLQHLRLLWKPCVPITQFLLRYFTLCIQQINRNTTTGDHCTTYTQTKMRKCVISTFHNRQGQLVHVQKLAFITLRHFKFWKILRSWKLRGIPLALNRYPCCWVESDIRRGQELVLQTVMDSNCVQKNTSVSVCVMCFPEFAARLGLIRKKTKALMMCLV